MYSKEIVLLVFFCVAIIWIYAVLFSISAAGQNMVSSDGTVVTSSPAVDPTHLRAQLTSIMVSPTIDAQRQALPPIEQEIETTIPIFSKAWADLAKIVPSRCDGADKLSWNGTRWECPTDLLGCAPASLALSSGRYSCNVQIPAGQQFYTTSDLWCTASQCVGQTVTCPRVCYTNCNCSTECDKDGKCSTSCDSCPYDCSYNICTMTHYFTCTGSFQCDLDTYQPRNHACTVNQAVAASCG